MAFRKIVFGGLSYACIALVLGAGMAQAQRPAGLPPDTIPPIDRGPRPEPRTPSGRPLPRVPLPKPVSPGEVPNNEPVTISAYRVLGSTVFSEAELAQATRPFIGKGTAEQLQKARAAVEKLYVDRGYATTGVFIAPGQQILKANAIINLQVQEGTISEIRIAGTKRVSQDYIRSRLRIGKTIFNYNDFVQAVGLLNDDSTLFNGVSAEILTGRTPGTNIVSIDVSERQTNSVYAGSANNQSANFGDWQRSIQFSENNVTGGSDAFSAFYNNTAGSIGFGAGYSLPISSENTRLSFNASYSGNRLLIDGFNALDITNNSRNYELGVRHPVIRRVSNNFSEELGVGFSIGKSDAEGFRNGVPTPLTDGADTQGRLSVTTLNFTQDYYQGTRNASFSATSKLRIGVDALGATTNPNAFLDGRFVTWQGATSYSNNLGGGNQLVLQGGVQIADRPLISLVQSSPFLQGYSPGILINDNGAYASAEVRVPIYKTNDVVLRAIPSLNLASTWGSINSSDPNTLVSAGIGVQLFVNNFNARLDWGIPLVFTNASKDNRLSFSVGYTLF
jgi:hemolysin activation/secretion protein